MIWLLPLIGGLLSRLHGSKVFPYKIVKSVLWAVPFTFLPILHYHDMDVAMAISLAVLCMGNALGKSTGGGGGIDLGTWDKPRENERLEILIKGLHGVIPEFWYDALLLMITGIAAVFGSAIACFFINPLFSVIILIGGALKPLGYIIGFFTYRKKFTEVGEFLTGVFAYFGLAMCWWMYV